MKEVRIAGFNRRLLLPVALTMLMFAPAKSALSFNDNLTAETLVAKHLDSKSPAKQMPANE